MAKIVLATESTPDPPSSGSVAVFADSSDGLLRSEDSDGVVTAYGGSQPLTSPLQIDGCVLWLDASTLALADDAAVALWPDGSPTGADAAQATAANKPVCKTNVQNGLRVVRFDPTMTDRFLAIDPASHLFKGAAEVTGCIVTRTDANDKALVADQYESEGANQLALGANGAAGLILTAGGSGPAVTFGSTPGAAPVSGVALVGRVSIGGLTDALGGGVHAAAPVTAPWPFEDTDMDFIGVGGDGNNNWTSFTGDVCEIIFYDRALTASEAREIAEYLSTKWATL